MVNVWDRPPAYYGLKGRDTIHTLHTVLVHKGTRDTAASELATQAKPKVKDKKQPSINYSTNYNFTLHLFSYILCTAHTC